MKQLLFLILLMSNTVFAQTKQKQNCLIYVNYPDYTVKASVSLKENKIWTEEYLTYYWYASNKIIQTKGSYDGKLLSGSYSSFYLSGNLKEKGIFKKGLKNDEWITWNKDGQINEINTWKNGVKNGICKKFDVNGNLISVAGFKNDQLNGCQTTYTDGKISSQKKFKNGVEVVEMADTTMDVERSIFVTIKGKVQSIFKKKDKKDVTPTTKTEKKKAEQQKNTSKKSFTTSLKEKWNSLFKKKEKSDKPQNTHK
jgi:hypothetical protein